MAGHCPSTRRTCTSGRLVWRFRRWVVGYVALALLLPGASLPFEVFEHELHHLVKSHQDDDGDQAAGHSYDTWHHHVDFSDVPGSPTHPLDHNCFECQVLQHLSRCVLPDMGPAIVPPLATCLVAEALPPPTPPQSFIAPRPRIRGPPALNV